MFEVLTELDRLGEVAASPAQRILLTAGALALVIVVLVRLRQLQGWFSRHVRPISADVMTTIVVAAVTLVAAGIVLGTWGQVEEIQGIAAEFEISGDALARVAFSLILLVGTYILTRFVRRLIHDVLNNTPTVTDHQREVTYRVTQVIIWAIAVVVVLGVWIDDLSGLLIGAGVLGVVLGMAAQKTLGAIVAGFVLMFARPFEIGDWIEVEDYEGVVSDISIVNTRIQSFDGEYVIVPNDVVSSNVVINRSKRGRLRIEVEVGVDYTDDVDHACELAREAVENLEEALSAPKPRVVTKRFDDSSVVLGVRYWIDRPTARRRAAARAAGVEAIKTAFEEGDVKIPFPQRELSGRAETGGFQHAAAEESDADEPARPPQEDDD